MPFPCQRRARPGEPGFAAPTEHDPLLTGRSSHSSASGSAGSWSEFPEAADESMLLQQSPFVNANSGWYLFFYNGGLCLLNLVAVMGSYFFVLASYRDVVPRCYDYSGIHQGLCNTCVFCFWTYPLLCPLVVVFLYFKNMIDTRLYYECLLNRIMLDFANSTWNHPAIWVLLMWGVGATTMLHYTNTDIPTHTLIFSMLAYFGPLLTFCIILLTQWEVKSHLIPLPLFTATNPECAGELLSEASRHYVPELQLRVAFEAFNDQLRANEEEHGEALELSTTDFFGSLREACQREMALIEESEPPDPSWSRRFTIMFAGYCGLQKRAEFKERFCTATRPEVTGCWFNCRRGYWAHRILFSPYLMDERAINFRKWARVYQCWMIFSVIMFLTTFSVTLATYLVHQHLVDSSNSWIHWLNLGDGFGTALRHSHAS